MDQSILFQEINEQPDAITELIQGESRNISNIANLVRGRFEYVIIAARGTSDNAARYAQYLMGSHNHLQVALATPSLFSIYKTPPNLAHALVIGISQSGQSPDIVSVIAEGKRQGRPTITITNDQNSPLANSAEFVIPLHAKKERAVAATKTYTTSLTALAILSAHLNKNLANLEEISKIPNLIYEVLSGLDPVIARTERYRYMGHCAVLGRGYNYATAFEVALKIKELTRIVAEPYSSADFRHGPIATVTTGFPVVLIAPSGSISADMDDLFENLKKLHAELIVISDNKNLLNGANLPLKIPSGVPEWLTPLLGVIPGQVFALHLAVARGLNPDQPAGLKKVTETL